MSGRFTRRGWTVFIAAMLGGCGGGDSTGPSSSGGLDGTWIVVFGNLTASGVTCGAPSLRLTLDEADGAVTGSFIADGDGLCLVGPQLFAGSMGAGALQAGTLTGSTLSMDLKTPLAMDGVVVGDSAAGTLTWNVLFPSQASATLLQASWNARRLPRNTPSGTAWRLMFDPTAGLLPQTTAAQFPLRALDRGNVPVGLPAVTYSTTAAPSRATVASDGVVTAGTSIGLFRVRAEMGRAWAEAVGYVLQRPTQVIPVPGALTFTNSGSKTIAAVVKDAAGATIPGIVVSFSSNDSTLVRVSNQGVVSTLAGREGSTAITLTAGTVTTAVPVTVARVPYRVVLDLAQLAVAAGGQTLHAEVRDSSGALLTYPVLWNSTNPAVVAVSASGHVTPVGPNGTALVIATAGGVADTTQVLAWNGPIPAIVGATPLGVPAWSVAVAPSGAFYVGGILGGGLFRGNLPATGVSTPLPLGGDLFATALDPAGARLYTGPAGGQGILVVDVATNTVVDSLAVPGTRSLLVTPDGSELWVGTLSGIFVYALPGLGLVDSLLPGVFWYQLSAHPALGRVYASTYGELREIDLATRQTTRVFPIGGGGLAVQRVEVLPGGTELVVALQGPGGGLRVIDLASGAVVRSTTLFSAYDVRYLPAAGLLLVTSPELYNGLGLLILDPVTLLSLGGYTFTSPGRQIGISPDGTTGIVLEESGGLRFVQ